jgi:FixJ family two-component response regulator
VDVSALRVAGEEAAREFLAWLAVGRAACLVLDMHLDGMSGFELQERLSVSVIFITAHDDATTHARIEQSSAAGHLMKPFHAKTVLDAIRRVLARDRLDQGPIGSPAEIRETGSSDEEAP